MFVLVWQSPRKRSREHDQEEELDELHGCGFGGRASAGARKARFDRALECLEAPLMRY
jgi:hypothetical protein